MYLRSAPTWSRSLVLRKPSSPVPYLLIQCHDPKILRPYQTKIPFAKRHHHNNPAIWCESCANWGKISVLFISISHFLMNFLHICQWHKWSQLLKTHIPGVWFINYSESIQNKHVDAQVKQEGSQYCCENHVHYCHVIGSKFRDEGRRHTQFFTQSEWLHDTLVHFTVFFHKPRVDRFSACVSWWDL